MNVQDLHIIVIGAGITGLLTCQGLKKVCSMFDIAMTAQRTANVLHRRRLA
ncbi:MAG: hypothetical protein Q9179_004040 [Wetmoreana sp. 5 TL-2023]